MKHGTLLTTISTKTLVISQGKRMKLVNHYAPFDIVLN